MSIHDTIRSCLDQGKRGVMATIVRRVGATPRDAGAKIFIEEGGKLFGTIGGGCVEAEAWQKAQAILQSGVPRLFHYAMDGRQVEDEGMICGGSLDIFMEPVLAHHQKLYEAIQSAEKKGQQGLVVTKFGGSLYAKTFVNSTGEMIGDELAPDTVAQLAGYFNEKKPSLSNGLIIEPVVPSSALYIYGAGHISQSISKIAKMVGFYVIVLDDRRDFANNEIFPEADEIIVDDFDFVSQHLPVDTGPYAVIVTRGHKHDAIVLEEVLKVPQRYIGMIGSKRKVHIIYEALKAKGVDEKLLAAVHAPIGIDINAETPEEIALSIVSELVKIRGGSERQASLT
jgi:xanthine dehydrogenase accessory factor